MSLKILPKADENESFLLSFILRYSRSYQYPIHCLSHLVEFNMKKKSKKFGNSKVHNSLFIICD